MERFFYHVASTTGFLGILSMPIGTFGFSIFFSFQETAIMLLLGSIFGLLKYTIPYPEKKKK